MGLKNRIGKVKRFSSDEISVFCDQIATLLNSGISLYEGVSILCNEMEEGHTRTLLHEIEKNLQARMSLSQALGKTGAFPEYMIHMVSVGETAGSLEKVMHSLSAYYERENKVKASIRSSVTYPAILFLMIAVILWALVFRILPLFESMYRELNAEVAMTSDNLMSFGINAGTIAAVIVGLLVLISVFLILAYRTKQGEKLMKRVLYNFPIAKGIANRISIGKFISSMALMLPAGMDTRKALDLAMETMDDARVLTKVKECKVLVEKGISLENAIQQTNLITGMDRNIIIVAAKSGNMDSAFIKLSERYNDEISTLLHKTATYVETALVVLLAVLIGFILLSVMLPLMNIISSIG
jgi:type IV pilus assembly protein PilC